VLNRSIPPAPRPVAQRPFPAVDETALANDIVVRMVRFGELPLCEVQVVFQAGMVYETAPALAEFTAKMLREGTRTLNASELAQALDTQGAFLGIETGYENTTVGISTLLRTLPESVQLLADVLLQPAFPATEFALLQQRTLQSLSVEAQRTGWHARRLLATGLFGEEHPYGRAVLPEHVQALALEHLQDYHRTHLHPSNCYILVAGQFEPDTLLPLLNAHFGHLPSADQCPNALGLDVLPPTTNEPIHFSLPGKQQSTLRLGQRSIARNHPDYQALRFATLVLGGFFGSRLMQNLREAKGYTYGVSASLSAMRHSGYLVLGTDVSNEHVPDSLVQMRHELQRLRTELLTDHELEIARNYLLGRMLSRLETPFEVADIVKTLIANGVPITEEDAAFRTIQALTAEDIRRAAELHFHPDAMVEVVCGG
jgi:zinc protease